MFPQEKGKEKEVSFSDRVRELTKSKRTDLIPTLRTGKLPTTGSKAVLAARLATAEGIAREEDIEFEEKALEGQTSAVLLDLANNKRRAEDTTVLSNVSSITQPTISFPI